MIGTRSKAGGDDGTRSPADTFADAIAELLPVAQNARIGVAVSGGGDSMALLAACLAWAPTARTQIHVATVNHGLRPEAASEAQFVHDFCRARSIEHTTLLLDDVRALPGNLSAHARDARYQALASWSRQQRLDAVLLGHTMDDQAETVLMRLARGSGAEGLSGMAARIERHDVQFLRPFLSLRREALRDWLRMKEIPWVDDPTNDDDRYDRVKIRAALDALEPLGIDRQGLARTATILTAQRRTLEDAADTLLAKAVSPSRYGYFEVSRKTLLAATRDNALRVFGRIVQGMSGSAHRPRLVQLERAFEDAIRTAGTVTLGGCIVLPASKTDFAVLCREPAALPDRVTFSGDMLWDHRWQVSVPDTLQTQETWIGPLGDGWSSLDTDSSGERPEKPDIPNPVLSGLPAIYRDAETSAPCAIPALNWVEKCAESTLSELRTEIVGPSAILDLTRSER